MAPPLHPIVSFWHGPMSWLERLSIRSFLALGHPVEVFSFDPIPDLPEGASWRDAATILPRDKLVFYKGKGTPGVFSDYFRARLLAEGRGIYADLDVYGVRPIVPRSPYLMGFERPGSVNGAVLLIPADAPLLHDLLAIFEDRQRPLIEPHLTPLRKAEVAARRFLGDPVPPEHMQYGATGPMALTYFTRRHGLWDAVQPQAVFYPVPYEQIPSLQDPGFDLDAVLKPETLAVHIWRSQLTRRGRADMPPPVPGSPLETLCRRHGVVPD